MKLFYRKLGAGPPLIIVHGLYGSSDNWQTVGKALANRYTVYLIDQRNHGRSPHSEIHDYPSMRDDLIEFMDLLEIPKAVFVGHSMGGKTVIFLAESHPEKIEALIVIDIAPSAYEPEDLSGQAQTHSMIMKAMMAVDFGLVKRRKDVDRQLSESIHSARVRGFLLKNVSGNAGDGFHWRLNLPVLYENLPNVLGGLDASKYSGGEEIAGFPVLFIRGQNSDYISDDDILVIQQIFPMARITSIPDTGHWLHVEQPALLIKTIRYFL